jgi:Ca2+-binding RTX toxin-like protein
MLVSATPTIDDGRPAAPTTTTRDRRRTRVHRWAAAGIAVPAIVVAATACISSAAVDNQTLTIKGSDGGDTIVLRLRAGDPNTLEVDDGGDGTADYAFDRSTFTAIDVEGGAGDDVLRIDHSNGVFTDTEATTLSGGDGNDTLTGDVGSERLDGGAGNDIIDGGQGNDVILAGDGDDTIQWDPGDGSDIVEGGAGSDHLAFHGANANEAFDVSANGSRVRLFRNVANITMDMSGIESLDLSMGGGTDTLTAHDLSGTDMKTVNADLSAIGGGDDGAIDEVIVPAGVPIGQDAGAATVGGLGAQVRVVDGASNDRIHVTGTTGADEVPIVGTAGADVVSATVDGSDVVVSGATPGIHVRLTSVAKLDISLGAGNDSFSASGNLAPLTSLNVDGGADADTILGGNGNDTLQGGTGDDLIDGNQGNDTILAGDGNDTIRWDPGDGSDIIEGGPGTDQLAFNAASINEKIDLSANGSRVRLTRDVGNIVMDLNGVETTGLALLGGADTLTVNDLTGTNLKTINANLFGAGGVDDGAADTVVVNGTAANDSFVVSDVGSTVNVSGLAAQVNITGSTAALDKLTLNGLAGTDSFSVTPGVPALIGLNLVP